MSTATKVESESAKASAPSKVPQVSDRLIYWFDWYLQRYFPKHFHAFAISNVEAATSIDTELPLIVYMNHASWWDPLTALVLAKKYFPNRQLFAPIDAVALQKYQFMQRLGFFPVEQDKLHGAGNFLKTSRAILSNPGASVWLTPEGQFADPRERDLPFQPGLAHLVSKMEHGVVLPLAMEYPFWEERLPEALGRFGEPISIADHVGVGKEEWRQILESRLRETQTQLESDSLVRNSEAFEILISGQSGIVWMYDILRRFKSVFTGKKLDQTHGDKLQ